ncbi:penicillin-binding protein [Candidatus Kuenenbacteria bacterium]|nr:penicillin-binding protein [Candidatus Kuenenbacteria bacterium]
MSNPQLRVIRHRPPQQKRSNRRLKRWLKKKIQYLFKRGFKLAIILGLIFVIYIVGAFAWYSRVLPDPSKLLERNISQSTKIYDRDEETVLYDVHGTEKRTLVELEEIPEFVQWATISAEDKHFYEHKGYNLLAMFKGVIIDPLMGKRARGGSTLTQQFVKNSILTNERRLSRKIKEFILSYKIEKVFEKDEILQMYLNEIPYGSVAYGIQSASQTFLDKDVQDLTLGEAAVLTALPQAPTYYSPYGSHKDELFIRQGYVLKQMVDNGYITEEQAKVASEEKIEFALKKQSITAPHFVMYVKELISEELGDELVETGGLRVVTTLDLEKQEAAEDAVSSGVEAKGGQYGFHNAALLSLDPKNGQVLAMVGSQDYFDVEKDGNVNVTLSLRQPGSSMKPLIYTAAWQQGYTPNTILYDVETTFKTDIKDYHPLNYDLVEHGAVSMRKALQGSLNIPAVKTIYLVGVQKVVDLLELFGYTSFEDRSRFGLSLVLGGGEVSLLEHTAAFGTLANQGVYHPPVVILRVEDSKGNILMEYEERKRKVIDKEIANITTNVLSDDGARAYVFGAGSYLTLPDRPAAAKTGTTNDYRDAWTMGYTPDLATGVWAGNNDNSAMKKGAAGGVIAAPIWHEYMKNALAGAPAQGFPDVEIESTGKAVLDGEIVAEKIIKIDKYSGKLATELTPPEAIEEKKFKDAHTILHYVYKDDPRGGVPDEPAKADFQYQFWEASVQEWLKAVAEEAGGEFVNEMPPSEFDDLHVEANKPTVFINSPSDKATISGSHLDVNATLSAPRGITRVEYYLDKKLMQTKTSSPYSLHYPISSYFVKGYHQLRVVAYDDVGNSNEAQIELNILVDAPPPTLNWNFPSNGAIYHQDAFPLPLKIQLTDLLATEKVNFYQKNKSTNQINHIGAIILPDSGNVTLNWPQVYEKGDYEIYAEIVDPAGGKHMSGSISIIID